MTTYASAKVSASEQRQGGLSFRVRRMGKLWEAYLKRPASDRPLFYTAPTKYEAIGLLLNGVARMAREQPGRLWPQGN